MNEFLLSLVFLLLSMAGIGLGLGFGRAAPKAGCGQQRCPSVGRCSGCRRTPAGGQQ